MRRLYVPDIPEGARTLNLPEGEARHARTVLRAREGDRFEILNGRGRRLVGSVQAVTRQDVSLVIESESIEERPLAELVLCQAVVKAKAMDLIVEKATEIGATRILPISCERSVVVGDKLGRWQDLAISALKQCGRAWLPEIRDVSTMADAIEQTKASRSVVASLSGERRNLWDCLEGVRSVALWIGPEGDFTGGEMEALAEATFISLGANVLRAETAAIAGLACIRHEWDRQGRGFGT